MASDSTIRVIQNGHQREYKTKAILGEFFSRLEKYHGVVEIADPDLESKLTPEELQQLYVKFPHLNPNRELPPKPVAKVVEFRETVKEPTIDIASPEQEERLIEHLAEVDEFDYKTPEEIKLMSVAELKDYLKEQEVEYNTRKKSVEYFQELALNTIK